MLFRKRLWCVPFFALCFGMFTLLMYGNKYVPTSIRKVYSGTQDPFSVFLEKMTVIGDRNRTTSCPVGYTRPERLISLYGPVNGEPCTPGNCECLRFRHFFEKWPKQKPKAAIYYLAYRATLLLKSLHSLEMYFNNKYDYPVIIFHEENFVPEITKIRRSTHFALFFQQIHFELPKILPMPVPNWIDCGARISYRHMCRFQSKTVYQQPILVGLDYIWRFDDDSYLFGNVTYDVFKYMQERNLWYGYNKIKVDARRCIKGLWKAAHIFLNATHLATTFFHKWQEPKVYYNNFEISAVQVWRSENYAKYIEYIDRLGGIYYHRWGDAPIKTIAVTMFVPQNRIHNFKDIPYKHK